MSYRFTRYAEDLVEVVVEGYMAVDHAECYITELWALLDSCPPQTDLLVDGRYSAGGSAGVRRRTEQILHHPHLGHVAFVVGAHHLLLFAPLVKLVSGVGLFGDEYAARDYLRTTRGQAPLMDQTLPHLPPPPTHRQLPPNQPEPAERVLGAVQPVTAPLPTLDEAPPPVIRLPSIGLPPPPAPRTLPRKTTRSREGD